MTQKVFKAALPYGEIMVFPQDDKIVVHMSDGDNGLIGALDRDVARMLHTDLGEMLATFELGAE